MEKRKITIINYFSLPGIFFTGGIFRTFSLCKYLSKKFEVDLVAFTYSKFKDIEKVKQSDYFKEICYEKRNRVYRLLQLLNRRTLNIRGAWPIFISIFSYFDRGFRTSFKKSSRESNILILEFPYFFPIIQKYIDSKFLIYDAHNVEYDYQKSVLPNSLLKKPLLNYLKFIESKSCHRSNVVFAVSEQDRQRLHKLYNIPLEKIYVVPHGVDIEEIKLASNEDKYRAKQKYALNGKKAILFMGSSHLPNMKALEFIVFKLAPKLSDFNFLIVGDIENKFKQKYEKIILNLENIKFFGVVSPGGKIDIMKASDIAINPMFSGAGANVKMPEYMAAGIPVVTTPFGARGVDIEHKKHAMICEADNFKENIEELYRNKNIYENLRLNARGLIEEKYNWNIIANKIEEIIQNYNIIKK